MTQELSNFLPGDRFGREIARRLSDANASLDHDIAERLRVARQQAVAARQRAAAAMPAVAVSGGGAALQLGTGDDVGLWARVAGMLPLLALVAGLLAIYVVQNDNRASEIAEIDAALLTDDLPTTAYTDPGFLQFLKAGGEPSRD